MPISLSTSAEIESDPARRLELIAAWTDLPELVTANQGEPGIVELCEHLADRGVGIEAGLLTLDDANAFVMSGIAERCVRVLIEPLDADPQTAVDHAAAMETAVTAAGIELEQVHHGDGLATWAVMERGAMRGHGIRVGLEDTTVLADGRRAGGQRRARARRGRDPGGVRGSPRWRGIPEIDPAGRWPLKKQLVGSRCRSRGAGSRSTSPRAWTRS